MSNTVKTTDVMWKELLPEGRVLYYEGDDSEEFRAAIQWEFGFDPAEPHPDVVGCWGEWLETHDGRWFQSFPFFCPPEHIDAIYGADERWPVGS
jgi:hypothetical protein